MIASRIGGHTSGYSSEANCGCWELNSHLEIGREGIGEYDSSRKTSRDFKLDGVSVNSGWTISASIKEQLPFGTRKEVRHKTTVHSNWRTVGKVKQQGRDTAAWRENRGLLCYW